MMGTRRQPGAQTRKRRSAAGRGLRRIIVVFKSHLDVGFTALIPEVLDSYVHAMVPRALEAIRQSEAADPAHPFCWTLPAWLLEHCLRNLEGSAQGQDLERRVRQGRITWHALPLTTHTEMLGLEDLVRGLYFARGLGKRFGRAAVAAKMTDVPGHTWILPTLLAGAGVTFLHLGCNPCSTPPRVPRLFRWEGPDGSRVITMYSQGGYGTPLLPPEDWDLPVWLALQHTSDNVGPQGAAVIPRLLAEVRSRFPKAEVTLGSLDDFARELSALDLDLPLVRQDLADSWIHGVGSMPAEVAQARRARNRLVQLESAEALRLLSDPGRAVPQGFAAAYENLLLFGEHTWGMDTKIALNPPEYGGRSYGRQEFTALVRSGKYDRIIRSWDDKRAFVSAAVRNVGELAEGTGKPRKPADAERRLEILNHHPWEWNGFVPLGIPGDAVSVLSETDSTEVPTVVIEGEAWALVRSLAPFSRTELLVRPSAQAAVPPRRRGAAAARARGDGTVVLENGLLRIRASGEAGINSLVDLRSGREWVDRRAADAFASYRYDVYSRAEIVRYLKDYAYDLEPWFLADFGRPGYPRGEHRTFTSRAARIRVENGRGWARILLKWKQDEESHRELGNAPEVRLEATLFDHQPFVDLRCTLEGKQECPMLEAGHLVLPLRVDAPSYAINKTGSVIDPGRDIAWDANRLLYCCDRWVDVSDRDEGMLVMPLDCPLFSIGAPAIERFDGSGGPGRPILWFNLFNNQWGTNFPQWIGGTLTFRFRLLPHAGDWRAARAWEHAAAAFQPPACLPSASSHPDRGRDASLVRVGGLPLETVTLKPAERGDGVVVRLRDPSGKAGRRVIELRAPHAGGSGSRAPRLLRCSLVEDELGEVALSRTGNGFRAEVTLRPFEIVTLKLTQ